MKVLITTDLYTTKTNGVVTSVRNLTAELERLGHDVHILTFSDNAKAHREDNVFYLPSASLEKIYPGVRMPTNHSHPYVAELISWKPDIIHSQCEFFSMQFAKQIARKTGAPIVHTYHALYEQYVPYLFGNQRFGEYIVRHFTRQRLKSVQHVVAPTKKVELALRNYGVTVPVSIIPSGISLERYQCKVTQEERAEFRKRLGIREDAFVLLNLGRLGHEKNVDELLTLFAYSVADVQHLIFLIVGDGPAKKNLEQTAKDLGIDRQVIFTGMVPPEQVGIYYQIADIFVCASTSETQGLTYIEAAANGLPLLCRQDPCLDGVLLEGENGYAYENTESFEFGLSKILADTFWREKASVKSKECAQEYSCEAFGKQIEALYYEAGSV